VVAILASLGVSFYLDASTASAPFQHLYYVPIVLAAMRFGTWAGPGVAFVAIVLYHLANPHLLTFHHEESDIIQVALFAAIGLVAGKLTDDARRLHQLAMTDDLTGLHNLRSFERGFTAMIRAARAASTAVAVLVLDLDRLKSLNDKHGHLAGAEAVRTVGHLIAATVPPEAVACRYGGDEFVIAIPDCRPDRAHEIAEALRRAVAAAAPTVAGVSLPAGRLTISVGVVCRPPDRDDGGDATGERASEALFVEADRALYDAKAAGRNGVHLRA
jgi:diguanylate cyclase (GGDEF)-like protein